jgi:hypothetical protein
MKYNELNLGQIEAIVNKLGGMEGVQQLLTGQIQVVGVTDVPEKDRVMTLADAQVAEQLAQGVETLKLGKVWRTTELQEMVRTINADLVKPGESTWRLPTKAELITVARAGGDRFGKWYAWSGDIDTTAPNCLWIVTMSDGENAERRAFGDSDGSQVSAFLVKTGVCK